MTTLDAPMVFRLERSLDEQSGEARLVVMAEKRSGSGSGGAPVATP